MTPEQSDFRVGVIQPVECIKEGWALIKDQYWLFFGITIVAMLIGGAVPIVLMGPMMIGLFLCLFQRQRGQPVEFGLLFKGFDQFVPGLIVTAIKVIPVIILVIPFYFIMFGMMMTTMPRGEPSPDEMSRFMVSFFGVEIIFVAIIMVASICVEIFFMFGYPLVADRKLSGLDAVKLSIKAGKANFGGVLGLLFLNGLITFAAALLCILPAYLYLPVAFASQAVAYRRIFPEAFVSPPTPPASWA
ncbi:MAG: hypothetical protein ACXW3C_06150 [Pyrinomonadaceae bacterium]